MPISNPPAITVTLPGSGSYEIQEASPTKLMVSGGDGNLVDFATNAKLAVQSALPNISTEMTGVENDGGELVGIFQVDGGNVVPLFQSQSIQNGASGSIMSKPNWIAVLPLTLTGGKPNWNNSDKWSQSWIVPANFSGIPVIELAPDTQDIKSFQGTLNDLSGPQAAQAASQIMSKYNVGAVVVAAYDEQTQQVSVWTYPGGQTTGDTADTDSDAHNTALSEMESLISSDIAQNPSQTQSASGISGQSTEPSGEKEQSPLPVLKNAPASVPPDTSPISSPGIQFNSN